MDVIGVVVADDGDGDDMMGMERGIVMVNVIRDGIENWMGMMMVSIVVVVVDDILGHDGMDVFDVDWDDRMGWDRIMMGVALVVVVVVVVVDMGRTNESENSNAVVVGDDDDEVVV